MAMLNRYVSLPEGSIPTYGGHNPSYSHWLSQPTRPRGRWSSLGTLLGNWHEVSNQYWSAATSFEIPGECSSGWWFGCHFLDFPIYWESYHPNWLSYFSEGWPNHQPVNHSNRECPLAPPFSRSDSARIAWCQEIPNIKAQALQLDLAEEWGDMPGRNGGFMNWKLEVV